LPRAHEQVEGWPGAGYQPAGCASRGSDLLWVRSRIIGVKGQIV